MFMASLSRRMPASVMPGLVPGIHVFTAIKGRKTWMAGTSPAMTKLMIGAAISGLSHCHGKRGKFKPEQLDRSAKRYRCAMRIEPVQPLFHRLAQIVAAAAERGVALVDEVALLPGQRQRGPMVARIRRPRSPAGTRR